MRLVECSISKRSCRCVGVGDGNSSVGLSRDDTRPVVRGMHCPVDRLGQSSISIGVSVSIAIDGDGFDIPSRVESTFHQHATQLFADFALKCLEGGRKEIVSTYEMLFSSRRSWITGCAVHSHHDGLIGCKRRFIIPHTEGHLQAARTVIATRCVNVADTEPRESSCVVE